MKLSLAVIANDEREHIVRIIADYMDYFDELVFLIDDKKTYDEFYGKSKGKVMFHLYERNEEEKKAGHIFFDRKRNELTKLLTGDYYFRLDTDDKIINPENIRPITEKAKAQGINIVYCWYEYAKDIHGNVHAAHYRETIVRVTDDLKWNKRIHENIIPLETSQHKYVIEESIKIEHMITHEKALKSGDRNLKYLIEEYVADKENCDPRTLAYLGRMLFTKDPDKSQFFLEKHIEKSGWDEDRYMSWCLLAEIMSKKGNLKDAVGCCFEALSERPDYPDAYLKLHSIYVDHEDWPKAIIWGNIGLQTPPPKTFMLTDPSSYTWRPMLTMAYAYYQTGKFEDAWRLFNTVKKHCPEGEMIKKSEQIFGEAVARKKFTDHFMWLFEFVKEKEPSKLGQLFDSIPSDYDDHEGLMALKHMSTPPKKWNDKSIVFYCGKGTADWADPSTLRGIGGSEEAVIYLSRELTKLGYEVTVFCRCGSLEGKYNGVQYLNSYKLNPRDSFNIFFAWRTNLFQLNKIKANKRFIWLHDVPQSNQFTKGEYEFDKVIVLSQYHKSLLPDHIPEDKIFVSTNGLNVDDFKKLDDLQRQPNRIIYASSYDRGLEELLLGWEKVHREVPDAELHIFYGWNTYKQLIKLVGSNRTNDFVEKMENLMSQPGVFEHGRVGHKELLKEYARSRIFAYPCKFIGEINCIALTKAVATGCVAVSNDFAVMKERNPHKVFTNEEFIDGLIDELKNPTKVEKDPNYVEANSWKTVAEEWKKGFLD